MQPPHTFVSTAEAAFVAGLDASDINRAVDDRLVPARLLARKGGTRRIARLAAALARVYIDLEDRLAARARRTVVEELSRRVSALDASERALALRLGELHKVDWTVALPQVLVDVTPQLTQAASRARQVDLADALVTSDPDIMGGAPCFSGTRVPIDNVLASLDEGLALTRLKSSYPFLTKAHVEAARVYLAVHPRRGRPRRLIAQRPALRPRASWAVRPADVQTADRRVPLA